MLYLSQLINAPIRDRDGERIATVRDLVVRIRRGLPARNRRRRPAGAALFLHPHR